MDWSSVTFEDVAVALKEVDWNVKPRPPGEFLSNFSAPNKRSKPSARLKCNVYYYRSNYFVWFVFCFVVSFFRHPLAFFAIGLVTFTALLSNDSFSHSVSERVVRAARKVHPPLAAAMRNPGSSAPPGRPNARRRVVYICGQDRRVVMAALFGVSALILWLTSALRTIGITLGISVGGIVIHGVFRTPNLKARLTNYHEEFRAVWRGYNEHA